MTRPWFHLSIVGVCFVQRTLQVVAINGDTENQESCATDQEKHQGDSFIQVRRPVKAPVQAPVGINANIDETPADVRAEKRARKSVSIKRSPNVAKTVVQSQAEVSDELQPGAILDTPADVPIESPQQINAQEAVGVSVEDQAGDPVEDSAKVPIEIPKPAKVKKSAKASVKGQAEVFDQMQPRESMPVEVEAEVAAEIAGTNLGKGAKSLKTKKKTKSAISHVKGQAEFLVKKDGFSVSAPAEVPVEAPQQENARKVVEAALVEVQASDPIKDGSDVPVEASQRGLSSGPFAIPVDVQAGDFESDEVTVSKSQAEVSDEMQTAVPVDAPAEVPVEAPQQNARKAVEAPAKVQASDPVVDRADVPVEAHQRGPAREPFEIPVEVQAGDFEKDSYEVTVSKPQAEVSDAIPVDALAEVPAEVSQAGDVSESIPVEAKVPVKDIDEHVVKVAKPMKKRRSAIIPAEGQSEVPVEKAGVPVDAPAEAPFRAPQKKNAREVVEAPVEVHAADPIEDSDRVPVEAANPEVSEEMQAGIFVDEHAEVPVESPLQGLSRESVEAPVESQASNPELDLDEVSGAVPKPLAMKFQAESPVEDNGAIKVARTKLRSSKTSGKGRSESPVEKADDPFDVLAEVPIETAQHGHARESAKAPVEVQAEAVAEDADKTLLKALKSVKNEGSSKASVKSQAELAVEPADAPRGGSARKSVEARAATHSELPIGHVAQIPAEVRKVLKKKEKSTEALVKGQAEVPAKVHVDGPVEVPKHSKVEKHAKASNEGQAGAAVEIHADVPVDAAGSRHAGGKHQVRARSSTSAPVALSEEEPDVEDFEPYDGMGTKEDLTETGFTRVRKGCCTNEMKEFIRRLIQKEPGQDVCYEGALTGMALWYDCEDDGNDFKTLEENIGLGSRAKTGDCAWIGDPTMENGCPELADTCPKGNATGGEVAPCNLTRAVDFEATCVASTAKEQGEEQKRVLVCGCAADSFPTGQEFELDGERMTVASSSSHESGGCSRDCYHKYGQSTQCADVTVENDVSERSWSFDDKIELIPGPDTTES